MAPKQPTHTTQTTEVKLPAWVDKASKSNYAFAQEIAAKPYNPYTGQTYADQSDLTTQAQGILAAGGGADQTGYRNAAALFDKAGKGIQGLDRSSYENPFQQDVINATVGQSQDALTQSLMGNADRASKASAFGGSRGAIVDGVTMAQNNKDLMSTLAGLNTANYNQATGAMQGDVNSMLAAGSGASSTQDAANNNVMKNAAGLLTAGAQDQQYNQGKLMDEKGKFDEAQNYDLDRLNILLSSLGMSPYGKTENTTKDTTQGSSGTDFAQMGLGVLSLLMGLSDRNEKTDIKKVGTSKTTGIPLYSYRYKGDPKTYPKIVGPMAQDVEKVIPEAVMEVDGVKLVNKQVLGMLSNDRL